MIIWSGEGYLVAVIVFVSSLLMELTTETVTGNEKFYQQNVWAFPVALLIAAGITYGVERLAFRSDGRRHTLFFIPMKWCPIVLAGLAFFAFGYRLAN